MAKSVVIRHEHRLGPGWQYNKDISELIELPEPLNEIRWQLTGDATVGQLSLQLINPVVLLKDIPITTSITSGDKTELKHHDTIRFGETQLELKEVKEYARLAGHFEERENYAFFAIRFNYPLGIFTTLTAEMNKFRKIVKALDTGQSNRDNVTQLFPPLEEWYESSVPSRPAKNCDQLEEDYDIKLNYEMDLSQVLNGPNPKSPKSKDSELFNLSTFCENLFQLRFFPETKCAGHKYGLSLRTDRAFLVPLNVEFGFEKVETGTNFKDPVTLEPGCTEVRTSKLHLRSSSLFVAPPRQLMIVEGFVTITLPKEFVNQFCREFDNYKRYAENLMRNSNDEVVIRHGSNEIKAHKGVLASASPYFEAMLMSSFLESSSGEIIFKESDINFEVLKLVVDYIYTDQIEEDILREHDIDIYEAATYFSMDKLKKVACESIENNLTPSKALLTMVSAHKHSDKESDLKAICMSYVIKNLYNCQKLSIWPEFFTKNYDLANELLTQTRKLVKYEDKDKKIKKENNRPAIKEERPVRQGPLMDAIRSNPRKRRSTNEVIYLSD